MGISSYLSKFALGVTPEGVLSPTYGGTGTTTGGGGGNSPTITAISYTGNDTATNTAGGGTVTLTGTNFATGVNVLVGDVQVSQVSLVSSTQLTFIAPANSAGSYILYVVNADGGVAISVPGIQYSGVPTWTTAAGSLGLADATTSFSTTLAATGDTPISYLLVSGALPSGLNLNTSTGVISGTTPSVSVSTTYNFTIRATDPQNQDTDRAFSLVVAPVVVGQQAYTTPGTYTWTAPGGVSSVCVVCVGGGGGANVSVVVKPGDDDEYYWSGGGGALAWKNNIAVVPGQTYQVVVGAGGNFSPYLQYNTATAGGFSSFNGTTVKAGGGGISTNTGSYSQGATGGTVIAGDGGGAGGRGGNYGGGYAGGVNPGGGGAGGYSGAGGAGADGQAVNYTPAPSGSAGSGGGGGGGAGGGRTVNPDAAAYGGAGGGVGILGEGASGSGGSNYNTSYMRGTGGSGGQDGGYGGAAPNYDYAGGLYGGGGGINGKGGNGAVRIIWGSGRAFPSTNTGNV
jgi:hypothetical protein